MSMPTADRNSGESSAAATGVPSRRGERPPGTADPLVGPPIIGATDDHGAPQPGRGTPGDPAAGHAAGQPAGQADGRAGPPGDDTTGRRSNLSDAPTGELVKRLSTQLSELVRGELELARVELTAKGRQAGVGAGLAGAGGVIALFGVGALIASAIAALALVVPVWLSALIVGVVLLLVAGSLALAGRNQLRGATPPVPEQAVESVQRDVETVKGAVQHR